MVRLFGILTLLAVAASGSVALADEAPAAALTLTRAETELLARGEISDGEMIAGGLVGTFFGLGVGHAIQGRYLDRGWMFTVAELGGVAAFVTGMGDCFQPDSCETSVLFIAGGLVMTGAKVLEVIDVWAGPGAHNRKVRKLRHRLAADGQPGWGLHISPNLSGDSHVTGLGFSF